MFALRSFVSFFFAISIVFAIFWGLQGMINIGTNAHINNDDMRMIDFISVKKEPKVLKKERVKPKKPKPKKQPPKPKVNISKNVKMVKQPIKQEKLDIDLPLNLSANSALGDALVGSGASEVSTNVIPLSAVEPRYPRRAKRLKKEGYVLLEFTITKQGTVKDVEVIEAKPEGLFEQSAKAAILKWKFRVKMENGQPIEHRASVPINYKLK